MTELCDKMSGQQDLMDTVSTGLHSSFGHCRHLASISPQPTLLSTFLVQRVVNNIQYISMHVSYSVVAHKITY